MEPCVSWIYISPQLYGICVNTFIMKSVYFKELHNEQEYYCPTIYRAGAAVVSTITSLKSEITVSFCFSERTETLTPFHYVRNRWRNNDDSNFYTRYYEYRGKFSCLCCHNKTSRYEVPIRDGPLFFWKVVGRGWGEDEQLSSANTFFEHICLCKRFFSIIFLQTLFSTFSVFFLFVLNITIALFENCFSKNLIDSAIATLYFVDIRSTHLFKFLAATDANKGHTIGNSQRE